MTIVILFFCLALKTKEGPRISLICKRVVLFTHYFLLFTLPLPNMFGRRDRWREREGWRERNGRRDQFIVWLEAKKGGEER